MKTMHLLAEDFGDKFKFSYVAVNSEDDMIGPTYFYVLDWQKDDHKPSIMLIQGEVAYQIGIEHGFYTYSSIAKFIHGGYLENAISVKSVCRRAGYVTFFIKLMQKKVMSVYRTLFPRLSAVTFFNDDKNKWASVFFFSHSLTQTVQMTLYYWEEIEFTIVIMIYLSFLLFLKRIYRLLKWVWKKFKRFRSVKDKQN